MDIKSISRDILISESRWLFVLSFKGIVVLEILCSFLEGFVSPKECSMNDNLKGFDHSLSSRYFLLY